MFLITKDKWSILIIKLEGIASMAFKNKINNFFKNLVGFYGISIYVGYLMPNPFLYK